MTYAPFVPLKELIKVDNKIISINSQHRCFYLSNNIKKPCVYVGHQKVGPKSIIFIDNKFMLVNYLDLR